MSLSASSVEWHVAHPTLASVAASSVGSAGLASGTSTAIALLVLGPSSSNTSENIFSSMYTYIYMNITSI
jgi:hypothetical protein